MKHFAILRDVPVGTTWQEVDAAAIQNMLYMGTSVEDRDYAWEARVLDVSWIRSYWEPGSNWGTCLYTGPNEETVRNWHEFCQVAYAGIKEIELEEAPEANNEYPRGFHADPSTPPLVAVETAVPGEAAKPPPGHRWLRTYRDPNSGEELHLFLPESATVPGAFEAARAVRRVVEVRPQDYD